MAIYNTATKKKKDIWGREKKKLLKVTAANLKVSKTKYLPWNQKICPPSIYYNHYNVLLQVY